MDKRETILVTGSAGFIGFHVARRLLELGCRVIGVDNLNDYYAVQLKDARNDILKTFPDYTFFKLDIADFAALEGIFQSHALDRICHLAAQAGVRYSMTNPLTYQRSNLAGFSNVIELARRNTVQNFVYASSSSVYGNNTKVPFSEEDPVDRPISFYAATKKSNELMAHAYSHLFGLPTIGLRFFTVYGPWGRPDMAYYLFTDAITNDREIQVFNNGELRRDFTYIDDVVQGVIAALWYETDERPPYTLMNLGNNTPVELGVFIQTIERVLGKSARKKMVPMQPGDVYTTYADIRRAKGCIGFSPQTSLADGIPRFVEWYRSVACEIHSSHRR